MKISKHSIRENESWITIRSSIDPSEYVIVHVLGKVRSINQPSETNIEIKT